MKATFQRQPEAVKVVTLEGKDYIYICANAEKVTENREDGTTEEQWICDYNEIIAKHGTVDVKMIKKNPESYIDYKI